MIPLVIEPLGLCGSGSGCDSNSWICCSNSTSLANCSGVASSSGSGAGSSVTGSGAKSNS